MRDTREWRVGNHYGIHMYAVEIDGVDDEPLGTALKPWIALQIVRDHNIARGVTSDLGAAGAGGRGMSGPD